MKIKFIKEYRALSGESLWNCAAHSVGAVLDVIPVQAQWLIDNGFAEEVKESGWWKPEFGEVYYFLGNTGKVCVEPWLNDESDEYRYSMGECFKTEKAAEAWRGYRIAIATVRQDEGVLTPEQGMKGSYVYCIYDNNEFGPVVHKYYAACTPVNTVLFGTREHAQASRDKHLDEWKIIANYDWSRE